MLPLLLTPDNNEGNEVKANKMQSKELLSSAPGVGNVPAPDLDAANLDEAPPTSIGVLGAHMPMSTTASREALRSVGTDDSHIQWTKLTALVMAYINEQDINWIILLKEFKNQLRECQRNSDACHCKMLKQLFETKFETAMATIKTKLVTTLNTALTPVQSQLDTLDSQLGLLCNKVSSNHGHVTIACLHHWMRLSKLLWGEQQSWRGC
jgi:hypothetical protein